MPGSGGVGAVTALIFAAFWLWVLLAAEEVWEAFAEEVLVQEVEAETTVLEVTTASAAAAATCDEDFLDVLEVVDFAGAEEGGLEGGAFAAEEVLEGALEGALEGGLAAEEAALETVFVTVLEEVPLIAAVVLVVVTNSLPFAAAEEPATAMFLSGPGLTGTATQGATNTGMASKIGIGGGGRGATG